MHEASGLFLFMWLIFTLYMTVAALRVSFLLASLFSVLSVTFVLLVIGDWAYVSCCVSCVVLCLASCVVADRCGLQ